MSTAPQHKRITIADPNEFMALLRKKASSNPLRKKFQMFIESVVFLAADGDIQVDVRISNTLVPGIARVGGSMEYTFGYLWESTAHLLESPQEAVTGTCFLTINERGLFDRLYGSNEDAAATLRFTDFTPREE